MKRECCERCHYWQRQEGDTGNCKRSFPQVMFGPSGVLFSIFPTTKNEDWCGEWKLSHYPYQLFEEVNRPGL
jgi:hypothetical protein